MKDIETKREREKKMISQMIALYCHRNHHTKGVLCPECAALNDYPRPLRALPVHGDEDLLRQLPRALLQT
mgnify:CR=1 FL=1